MLSYNVMGPGWGELALPRPAPTFAVIDIAKMWWRAHWINCLKGAPFRSACALKRSAALPCCKQLHVRSGPSFPGVRRGRHIAKLALTTSIFIYSKVFRVTLHLNVLDKTQGLFVQEIPMLALTQPQNSTFCIWSWPAASFFLAVAALSGSRLCNFLKLCRFGFCRFWFCQFFGPCTFWGHSSFWSHFCSCRNW